MRGYDTVTLCPRCERLMPGRVVARPDGVFVTRDCPEHGRIEGLVCSDVEWWESLPRFDVEPVKPKAARRETQQGCPSDCGLCPAHRQIAGTAAIEISNRCNASCPVCLADNQATFDLSLADAARMIETLIAAQGRVDVLTLSGGEPTLHPQILDILRLCDRDEIGRVALNSNGLRIASDDGFLEALARHPKLYVSLHHDGSAAKRLRGIDPAIQELALERLGRHGIKAAPVVLAAKGVNEDEIGDVVLGLLTRHPEVHTVIVTLMAYAGRRGARFPGDPRERLTIPGALDAMERGTARRIRKRDFIPLPMPNPMCAAVAYFLVDGDLTPLLPLSDVDRVVSMTKNANFADAGPEMERFLRDIIDRVYARPERHRDPESLLRKLRDLLLTLFPEGGPLPAARRRALAEERVKVVYLMQFMDAYTFDSRRLSKCSCQHLLPDGSVIPSCGYYTYHRRFDRRFHPCGGGQALRSDA